MSTTEASKTNARSAAEVDFTKAVRPGRATRAKRDERNESGDASGQSGGAALDDCRNWLILAA